jgi:hypothetical protein
MEQSLGTYLKNSLVKSAKGIVSIDVGRLLTTSMLSKT